MQVLVLHNRYRQHGGEDAVVQSEIELLRSNSVGVTELVVSNDESRKSWRDTVQLGIASSWSRSFHRTVAEACADVKPDIVHVHNFWMRLSPSVHWACHQLKVPTVQTLHNFRLLCVRADFVREGKVCEQCLGRTPWRGVVHRCYRDSLAASITVAGMISTHRMLDTWDKQVSAFIALSEHSKEKFIKGGIPGERIFVRPNFVEDTAGPTTSPSASNVILYVGRLSDEKGVYLLLRAWRKVHALNGGVLRIIGDGPLRPSLEEHARAFGFGPNEVQFAGALPFPQVMREIGAARALALPSLCFENCSRTLLEAFACGRPVVAPDRGSLDEMVSHRETGLKFQIGQEKSLTDNLLKMLNPLAPVNEWGQNARLEYLNKYTPSRSFSDLIRIYRMAGIPLQEQTAAASFGASGLRF